MTKVSSLAPVQSEETQTTEVVTSTMKPLPNANYKMVKTGKAVFWEKDFYAINDARKMVWQNLISQAKTDNKLQKAIDFWFEEDMTIPTHILCNQVKRKLAIKAAKHFIMQAHRVQKDKSISLSRKGRKASASTSYMPEMNDISYLSTRRVSR